MPNEDISLGMTPLYRMLRAAFIEIRATDNLETAKAIADIFHNVPSMIMNNKPVEEIYLSILERSDFFEMRNYVEKLVSSVSSK
jgi:hypothetical protein